MIERGNEAPIASAILFLLAGPILWAIHLLLVYGVQSAACAVGNSAMAPSVLIQASVSLATLGAILLLCFGLFFPGRLAHMLRYEMPEPHNRSFSVRVERLLSLLSLMGVVWSGASVFQIDVCGLLR